jgi:hypothetical protein
MINHKEMYVKNFKNMVNFYDLSLKKNSSELIDVIIPLLHVNQYFEVNLLSVYREIPVHNLLIGDAGINDDTIYILNKFPRVKIFDHKKFTSLGFSLKYLINEVSTKNFIYLHSDVYLPENFYSNMSSQMGDADFLESDQNIYIEASYIFRGSESTRAYSGAQLGVTNSLKAAMASIDDDYLYRSEDIIIQALLKKNGYKYKKNRHAFHLHQICDKVGANSRVIEKVDLHIKCSPEEEIRSNYLYLLSFLKYTKPSELTPDIIDSVLAANQWLIDNKILTHMAIFEFSKGNIEWIPILYKDNPTEIIRIEATKNPTTVRIVFRSLRYMGIVWTIKKIWKKIFG